MTTPLTEPSYGPFWLLFGSSMAIGFVILLWGWIADRRRMRDTDMRGMGLPIRKGGRIKRYP